jgi:putative acetyltransferase
MIRPETEVDLPAIDDVNQRAFGRADEALLVRRLRDDGLVVASLVAEQGGAVVGHVMLSWLPTRVDGHSLRVVALAPVAVLPERQRQGIGSRLVEGSIEAAREHSVAAIIVLGHPRYYPRFGFSAAAARGLAAPFSGKSFMALELVAGSLAGKTGTVHYPSAFGIEQGARCGLRMPGCIPAANRIVCERPPRGFR